MKSPAGVSNLRNCAQAAAILLIVWMFAACDQRNEYVEPPLPKVTVAKPLQQEIIDYLEFTGTTHAFEEVEMRARVAGFLQSMEFTPGTRVEKGDLLFVIDPSEYQADLDAAEAEQGSTEATLKRAQTEFARAQKLFKQKAGAQTDVVKWRGGARRCQGGRRPGQGQSREGRPGSELHQSHRSDYRPCQPQSRGPG